MQRYRVIITVPGPTIKSETMVAVCKASLQHDFEILPVNRGPDNFNECWCDLINLAKAGRCDLGAMVHADIVPQEWWLDPLAEVLTTHSAHVVSAVVPKRDLTGCLSCGVGNPEQPMGVHRHMTLYEAFKLPETFGSADFGYPGWPLLFNSGCMLIDLRDGLLATTNPDGSLFCWFNFVKEYGQRADGTFGLRGARSEDYWFASQAHALGAKCFCTRKVQLYHGSRWCNNYAPWGTWENGDELNASKWRSAPVT